MTETKTVEIEANEIEFENGFVIVEFEDDPKGFEKARTQENIETVYKTKDEVYAIKGKLVLKLRGKYELGFAFLA